MTTLNSSTARMLMYAWHGGQSSPFYAAASSGLVESFEDLLYECSKIDEPDRTKLMTWIRHQQKVAPSRIVMGKTYRALPWAKVPPTCINTLCK